MELRFAGGGAEFFAPDGGININRGTPWEGRSGVEEMAAGFYADIPDLALVCDGLRIAGDHVLYQWTVTGTHAASRKPVRVIGLGGVGHDARP